MQVCNCTTLYGRDQFNSSKLPHFYYSVLYHFFLPLCNSTQRKTIYEIRFLSSLFIEYSHSPESFSTTNTKLVHNTKHIPFFFIITPNGTDQFGCVQICTVNWVLYDVWYFTFMYMCITSIKNRFLHQLGFCRGFIIIKITI